jgi:hypothetical protein
MNFRPPFILCRESENSLRRNCRYLFGDAGPVMAIQLLGMRVTRFA